MLAVILAGGLGTRLRPLTDTRPKPLLPILDRPMVEYIITSLPNEVSTVIMAVSYMSDTLREHFSSKDLGRELIIVEEEEPLGTGGAIRNVARYIDDTFLVFNGDVLCSLDIGSIIDFHRSKKGIGTIALWKVDDPSRYGVVELDRENRIQQFLEKVPKEEAPSDLINAGIYVLEPGILDHMPSEAVISIEREVFPKVLGKGLYGFMFEGHWVDAGTLGSFLEAQGNVLAARGNVIEGTVTVEHVRLRAPVHLSSGCVLGKDVELGPNVFLGKGTSIGEGSRLINCAVFDGGNVGNRVIISGSILGHEVLVKDSTRIENRIVGDKEEVGP